MQYYSPLNGRLNGETSFPYVPIPPVCAQPHIVGEGDVTSVTLPDGTLQLYFVPAQRTYLASYLPWGAVPAWFIRTIPNLFAAARPFAAHHRDNPQSSNTFLFPNNAEESEEKPKYQLQFHNDKSTSSTDLHYFTPPPPPCRCRSKSVGTQADHPTLYHGVCRKACRCKACGRRDPKACESAMSVDSITEDKKPQSKVKFGSDTSDDKCCYKCKDKCNSTKCTYKK